MSVNMYFLFQTCYVGYQRSRGFVKAFGKIKQGSKNNASEKRSFKSVFKNTQQKLCSSFIFHL